MTSRVITVQCGGPGLKIPNRRQLVKAGVEFTTVDNRKNNETPRACLSIATTLCHEDILVFTHDDVTIHDPDWHASIMACFQDECENHVNTVAVGFGGAPKLGHPNLYKRPYRLNDMARDGYVSNQTDALVHGQLVLNTRRVAVLDAFVMAVRRSFIVSVGGWPSQLTHHGLDLWLGCMAARHGKSIYMTGVSCTHHGGGTSIKSIYRDAKWLQGGTLDSDHQTPHRWLYDEFRDVLPIDVRT